MAATDADSTGLAAAAPAAHSTRRQQVYAVVVLLAIYACHSIDRGIAGIVMEPIRKEFGASDAQLGLITLTYTLAFMAAMVPVGVLIDRKRRIRLLAVLVTIWSACTALAGLAGSLPALMAARAGVGAAEAGGHPTSMSLISDIVPKERRGTSVGLFYVATGIGSIVVFLVGGYVAANYGWRATFFMAGVPGLLLALLALATVREPVRGAQEAVAPDADAKAPPLSQVLKFMVTTPAVANMAIAAMLASSVNSSFHIWLASFLMRNHHLDLKQVGLVGALGPGVLQACGALASGFIGDWLARRHPHRVGYAATVAIFLMAPLGMAYSQTPSLPLAITLVSIMGFCAGSWMAPTFTLLIAITAPRMRGVVIGVVQMLAAAGSGFGPVVVGLISDQLGGQIHTALTIGLGVAAWAALHSFIAVRASRRLLTADGARVSETTP